MRQETSPPDEHNEHDDSDKRNDCTSHGCCVYPHSPMSIVTMILSIITYILSQNATWNCYFVQAEFDGGNTIFSDVGRGGNEIKFGLGPFSREDLTEDLSCILYSRDDVDSFLDAPYKTSRIFGAFANLLLGIVMIALICTSCMSYYPIVMKVIGVVSIVGSGCLGMTFFLFSSDLCENCSFHVGAGVAVVGVILALINGVIVLGLPPSKF
uniref:Uncharacterized protein n=1 Tax=Craspedostauros australis TaxID=1486917 RepID=A0A7R9WR39_9STRA|mmetsp:Transcript_16728/g.46234  ORF Transcript_16728/g.46234 Transcript_16728/m.46234 type:complete len:211 (+) Transcript_16728:411-1043(+)|eukprot:CAMPEP_0198111966 /NCGR_PEP_ID=MMETSP1442-20131203/3878_1 /TAXON_ID= /ORGANISM="Craspedostauros australis, Strain CCMP3328" /LENGTH=210 /DNA_ID=CAMNT_0043768585 /DNA_START=384 /DNA_END=1016 /DNA_ORIENTATION=-